MAAPRRRRRTHLRDATHCRLPRDLDTSQTCATEKGLTLCVGDRVERPLKNRPSRYGVVLAVHPGADNSGRKKMAASVCFDGDDPGDLAYPYLFIELRKKKR